MTAARRTLSQELTLVDQARQQSDGRADLRRLTRAEYEYTVRDLLGLPILALRDVLPDDGEAHGFDKLSGALDVSHVQLARYMEAATLAVEAAIASSPEPPQVLQERWYPARQIGLEGPIRGGDAILLRDKQPLPGIPVVREKDDLPKPLGTLLTDASDSAVGFFRHEDAAFRPRFRVTPSHSGRYRLRASLWGFWWNQDHVEPSPTMHAAAFYAGNRVIDYFDAPSIESQVHEVELWMNAGEEIGFNAASLHPIRLSERPGRTAEYTGPGIAVDWVDFEGPLVDAWPPESHRRLFGDLPFIEIDSANTTANPPRRVVEGVRPVRNVGFGRPPARNKDGRMTWWTVHSESPQQDAQRLIAAFLERAFRRPPDDEDVQRYVSIVSGLLADQASFEEAMATAYRISLCDPHFLFHRQFAGELDQFSLASRLSYFLWCSLPDEELYSVARQGRLSEPAVLRAQVERMLDDPKSERFVVDFLNQWLGLDRIDETTPDAVLYPEFGRYLRDSMVYETRAFFRELLTNDESVMNVVASDFGMLNQKLAEFYGIEGVIGDDFRRVAFTSDSHRGGFLTQASILKLTANGTTTSPVPRGVWVVDKLLGQAPQPPPPGVAGIEPDTRGATTIREQLNAHRNSPACATCHREIDPPGFALECFDAIGGYRERYRSTQDGDEVAFRFPNGRGVKYRLGPAVDSSGVTHAGEAFAGIDDYRRTLRANPDLLTYNLVCRLLMYSTGSEISFADREEIERIVSVVRDQGYGIRTLIHEVVQSRLFRTK